MKETEDLLHEIQTYLIASRMAPSTFGRLAVNDGKLISRLRAGGSVTLTIASKIRSYIDDHPPQEHQPPFSVAGDAS
ncbi:hypothetical protein [Methylocella tundrae]|uniref:Uncharacterized protein n=1 Tax=Methylocella tundrae TaxID=227605 RepID=A0A4U8Z0G9_METTU|nr:hypothetical protein [Methylocella tundrae]WPP05477.1 hypothetical protein SIN04_06545 [Methylocella tundrae]VFU07898.1 conserved protein of unknown function [Methylocella tundrae]